MIGIVINMMIHARYPGGSEAFDKDFCMFFTSDNTLVIAPYAEGTGVPEELKEGLNEMASGMGFKVLYSTVCNFQGVDKDEASERFNEFVKDSLEEFNGRLMIQANYSLVEVTVPGMKKDTDEAERLIELLKGFEDAPNFRVVFKDGDFIQVLEEGAVRAPKIRIETGIPGRDRAIGKDDIMDLQIALGSCQSVEDFLAMM